MTAEADSDETCSGAKQRAVRVENKELKKIEELIKKTKQTFADIREEVKTGCSCASREDLSCRCVWRACKVFYYIATFI
jgi:hypothetical protein